MATKSSVEISMYPKAFLELPMSKPPKINEDDENLFGINLSIEEKLMGNKFDHIEITITVEKDDPRLRAFDVYTQYGGCYSVVVKHHPQFWPNGIIFKQMFPNWDNEADRVLDPDATAISKIEQDIEYNGAAGLRAHSFRKEINQEGSSPNCTSSLELGMLRGKESESNDDTGKGSTVTTPKLLVKLSEPKTFTLQGGSGLSDVAIADSHNPICAVEYVLKDHHPIPFSVYMIDYYYLDDDGNYADGTIPGQLYNPDHLKAGIIISKSTGSNKNSTYGIRVMTGGGSSGWTSEIISVENEWNLYEIDQFVILAKVGSMASGISGGEEEEIGWTIQPSSKFYWRNAVEFLRDQLT